MVSAGNVPTLDQVNTALPPHVRVTGDLGRGGQGVVYRGTVNGVAAAIKIYAPGQVEARIDREIAALTGLTCPMIAPLLWSGTFVIGGDTLRVVATRLIDGKPLNDVITQRRLTDAEVGTMMWDVAKAVESLWSIRLVHRDLKPSNVILGQDGRATVIDLGLARHLDLTTITIAGATGGTLGYMSPEQTRGQKQLTYKSDLYALGVIAVESALQRHPTNRDQMRLINGQLYSRLPGDAAQLSMADLIKKMLEFRPTRRATLEQVFEALDKYKR